MNQANYVRLSTVILSLHRSLKKVIASLGCEQILYPPITSAVPLGMYRVSCRRMLCYSRVAEMFGE